ncbi:MAG: hypothetical protein K0R02_42 [Rickettsiaceae bacterium]|jgi:hypothetical protein|nr:hypothetical protein [Rickettsiaceae bacterium]
MKANVTTKNLVYYSIIPCALFGLVVAEVIDRTISDECDNNNSFCNFSHDIVGALLGGAIGFYSEF